MGIDILTNNGMDIHLVRYFDYQGKKYLIFTVDGNNESDDQGHVFVHISEINNLTATVVDGDSYETVKSLIKDIVTKNRNNIPLPITDLNYNELNGLNIISDKQLGLLPNYVDLLRQNQPTFNEVISAPSSEPAEFAFTPFSNPVEPIVADSAELTNNPQPVMENDNQNAFNFDTNVQELSQISNRDNYEQLYLEQVELVNKLNSEIEIYKNKIESLKSIINN